MRLPNPYPFSYEICEKDTLSLANFWGKYTVFLTNFAKMYLFLNKISEKWHISLLGQLSSIMSTKIERGMGGKGRGKCTF